MGEESPPGKGWPPAGSESCPSEVTKARKRRQRAGKPRETASETRQLKGPSSSYRGLYGTAGIGQAGTPFRGRGAWQTGNGGSPGTWEIPIVSMVEKKRVKGTRRTTPGLRGPVSSDRGRSNKTTHEETIGAAMVSEIEGNEDRREEQREVLAPPIVPIENG